MTDRALVLGGAGFIGSHTVDKLLSEGYEVMVLDSLERPVHTSEVPRYLPKGVRFVRGSITDREALLPLLKEASAVLHFAAYQDYMTDFHRFFQVNAVGTALIYELIVEHRLELEKVVVASSQAVYGEGRYRCSADGAVVYPEPRTEEQLRRGQWEVRNAHCEGDLLPERTPETVTNPHNSYGISKLSGEALALRLGQRYGIPTAALRYSIVQGPRQSFTNVYSGALRSFAVRVLNGRAPVVYEDGRQIRDYVWIGDVVEATWMALRDPTIKFRALNVGGEKRVTVDQLARIVIEEADIDCEPILPGVYRSGDTRHVFSDVSELKALGWRTTLDQREVVRAYLAWAQEQPDLRDTFEHAERIMRDRGVLRGTAAELGR